MKWKAKEKGKDTQLNTEFQRIARRDKKTFLNEQAKEIGENNRIVKTRDLFKKIGDTKGTFHAKRDTIKDRNGKDLTEAEEIKKKWQEYSQELYKKGLNDLDNQDGVVTHLEPDILECEVTWPLGIIATNKHGGGDRIPAELFKIVKDSAVKDCIQHVSKFGKLGNGQTTIQLCSFHMLPWLCSKSFKLVFNSTWTANFQMFKLDLEKAERNQRSNCQHYRKSKKIPENISSAPLTMLQPLTVSITMTCVKFLKRREHETTLPLSWKTCMQVKKQQLEPDMEQLTGSNWVRSITRLYTVTLLIQLICKVQFSHSVMSESLWLHRLLHTRFHCPSPTPGAYSNSCPSSRWCHPIISSSVVPLSSCLQSFPASGSFPMSQLFHQVAKVLELQL